MLSPKISCKILLFCRFSCSRYRCSNPAALHLNVASRPACPRPQVYTPGDILLTQGQVSDQMYIIERGSVEVDVGGAPLLILGQNAFFGESWCTHKWLSEATYRALGHVQVGAMGLA